MSKVEIDSDAARAWATVAIDVDVLAQILMPKLNVRVERCSFSSDPMRGDAIVLHLSGPDVPDCDRAEVIMTQTYDYSAPRVVLTAVLKPVEGS